MTCGDIETAIDDYVDGTLDGVSRDAVESHLAACPRCRALADDFQAIRSAAQALEPVVPSPRLWTRIATAVEAEPRGPLAAWGLTWQTLQAALVALLLVAGLSWVGSRLTAVNRESGRLAATGPRPIATELALAEAAFTSTIAGLEPIADAQQSQLDQETADVVRTNLSLIDGAIVESRAALATEPDSDIARQSLFEALRSKVELLQDVIALVNEMRKGDPEGAARVASELNP